MAAMPVPMKMAAAARRSAEAGALGAPALQCGKYPAAPGICNDRTQFFLYKGKHAFVKTAGWLQPPS